MRVLWAFSESFGTKRSSGTHSVHKSHELVRSAVRWGHWKHGYVWKLSGLLAVWEKWWSDVWSSRRQLDNWWESMKNTSCFILIFREFLNWLWGGGGEKERRMFCQGWQQLSHNYLLDTLLLIFHFFFRSMLCLFWFFR